MLWLSLIFQLHFTLILGVVIKGRLDINPRSISHNEIIKTSFHLYQFGNTTTKPYIGQAKLKDLEGNFQFDIPIDSSQNLTGYFILVPRSLEFNLKPNRVLVKVTQSEKNNVTIKAYKNIFGREYFPSPDIIFPEELEEIVSTPFITISFVSQAPFRNYVQRRNLGLLKSSPLGHIVNSKYKLAGVITIVLMIIFPMIVGKLDPETARAIKRERLQRQRDKYVTK